MRYFQRYTLDRHLWSCCRRKLQFHHWMLDNILVMRQLRNNTLRTLVDALLNVQ
jgi:hypothetical protein